MSKSSVPRSPYLITEIDNQEQNNAKFGRWFLETFLKYQDDLLIGAPRLPKEMHYQIVYDLDRKVWGIPCKKGERVRSPIDIREWIS